MAKIEDLINSYKKDRESVYNTWFVNNVTLSANSEKTTTS